VLNIGTFEILIIILIALLVIGPAGIPKFARTLGKMFSKVRDVTDGFKNEIERNIREESKPDIQDSPPKENIRIERSSDDEFYRKE
jgi:Tat protein translocase TatB subunit